MLSLLLAVTSISYVQVASQSAPFELVVERNSPSSQGLLVDHITLRCRRNNSGTPLLAENINYWVNRTKFDEPDLKEKDYVRIASDGMGITFQLKEEGNYTCGERDPPNVVESVAVTLIGKLF